jgi:hypothetical protein
MIGLFFNAHFPPYPLGAFNLHPALFFEARHSGGPALSGGESHFAAWSQPGATGRPGLKRWG